MHVQTTPQLQHYFISQGQPETIPTAAGKFRAPTQILWEFPRGWWEVCHHFFPTSPLSPLEISLCAEQRLSRMPQAREQRPDNRLHAQRATGHNRRYAARGWLQGKITGCFAMAQHNLHERARLGQVNWCSVDRFLELDVALVG